MTESEGGPLWENEGSVETHIPLHAESVEVCMF